MHIGQLSQVCATPAETIRFYEREGLLMVPGRTLGNYRIYTAADADRLAFIRRCRNLDMTLDEVRALLRLKDEPQADCAGVDALIDEHIRHVAQRIRELRGLEKTLRALRALCTSPQAAAACGILHGIGDTAGVLAAGRVKGHVPGAHR